ncbi:MAG: hypothetical protein JNL21_33380 [Myxococcales bacterium]|nr:hypothetical protein [Myxococcales bacterium]
MVKRRFLVRSVWLLGLAAPAATLLAYGCESETQYDDLCAWVSDPGNCYVKYFEDVQARCGAVNQPRPGVFAARDKLDNCFLSEGGIVTFEPPIDLTVPLEESEEPLKFTMVNADSTPCGTITFKAKYDFTVDIVGDPVVDGGVPEPEDVTGGKFSMEGGKDFDTVLVTCPQNPVSFKFDRLQITKCQQFEELLPHAEIDFNPGGVGQTGLIRARIFYPPLDPDYTACKDGSGQCPSGNVVTYFECAIPAAPPPCENGEKDGAETDIDCGGGFCTTRCGDGQMCLTDGDCVSNVCDVVEGLKVCIGPG